MYAASRPKSYDECVVAEMRGQDQSVLANVQAVCQRRFYVLVELEPPAGQWNFSRDNGKLVVMLLSPFSDTYRVSRIEAQVTPGDCNATIGAQWSDAITLWSTTDFAAEAYYDQPAQCMRVERIFAYRK